MSDQPLEPTAEQLAERAAWWARDVSWNLPVIEAIEKALGCDRGAATVYYSERCLSMDINAYQAAMRDHEKAIVAYTNVAKDQFNGEIEIEQVGEGEWEKPQRARIRRIPKAEL